MKQPSVTIGIDLGTTNSVVALWDGTQARVCGSRDNQGMMPSVFGWQKPGAAGEGAYLVGRPALNNWRAAPEDTVVCVKRLMGRYASETQVHETRERFFYRVEEDENKLVRLKVGPKSFTPVEISAQYLRHLKERAERDLGRPGAVTSAVITVPAYFEERQRAATRQAGKEAGLVVKKIIDEPTAAAIAFGFSETPKRQQMLVFDLGGGTFDISIIQFTRSQRTGAPMFEVQAIDGDNWLGGSDFDQRIVDHVVEDFKQRHQIDPRHDREFMTILRQGAEQAKISLSEDGTNQVRLTLPAAYRNDGKILGVDIPLQRDFYEKLITPDVNKAMAAVQRALDSQTLPPDGITMVLLVGGATYTPLVRQRLAALFGPAKINSSIDAMTSVAIGAAILAGKLKGIECPNSECGETQSIKDAKTGKTRTVLRHHVNDETRETCEKCSTPLAAGRAATHDIYYSEVTACSLGILAVKGDQPNAFVSLINKGTTYPLSEPVRETFYPMADNTRAIRVPVFEAIDDRGAGRKLQGDILFALTEDITANTPIEVALNLDRNRIVTVAIQVKGSSIPPCIRQLELKEPPVEKAGAEKKTSWDRRLENWMRHLNQLVKRYGNYLEPRGLRAGKLQDDLERAAKALDAGDRDRPAPPEVQKILLILEADLLESGVGTQLYLADLELEDAPDKSLREQAMKAQDDLKKAFDRKDQQKIEIYIAALRNLLAQIDKQRDRSKTTPEEQQYNPLDLLRKD